MPSTIKRLVVLGDSLITNSNEAEHDGGKMSHWTSIVGRSCGIEVINTGFGGSTAKEVAVDGATINGVTYTAAQIRQNRIYAYKPSHFILHEGGNNLYAYTQTNGTDSGENIFASIKAWDKTILQEVMSKKGYNNEYIKPILIAMPCNFAYWSFTNKSHGSTQDYIVMWNRWISDILVPLSNELSIPLIRVDISTSSGGMGDSAQNTDISCKIDGVHHSIKGEMIVARIVSKFIRENYWTADNLGVS